MITADKVVRNAYTENMGSDLVAVDDSGRPIGRDRKETIRLHFPDAAGYFSAEDLAAADGVSPAPEPVPVSMQDPFARVLGQISPAVLKDYRK